MSESNSTEKLIERIVADARADSERVCAEAEAKAREIAQAGERDAARILMDGEAAAQRAENDTLTKARTNAELDARKFDLKSRRTLVDRAYKAAFDRLCALEGEALVGFLKTLLINEADGGETVRPAKNHAKATAKAMEQANAELTACGKAKLVAGEVDDTVSTGFMLVGKGYVKLCSFEELIADLKEKEFSSVASQLFS